ncbi:hypothetical protein [Christiangramia sediminis]|uniref:TerB family tellurite resistance protein n=1 Tax=Christiangramia sediminis TaxID=2881336 RepID=A0A9X1LII1_9FLAO|nr:hypothetical protein [Christiangramia sediminis]MCB7481036.1 hypothetical protein [Christiangramia sediminis]
MKHIDPVQNLFYQKLGELFYAIAAADKVVREEEFKMLKDLVLSRWIDIDDYIDSFGTDSAYQMEIVFEWFDYEGVDAQECYESFREFMLEHQELFTEKRKKLILETASKIARVFSGINKSELVILSKLDALFKKTSKN